MCMCLIYIYLYIMKNSCEIWRHKCFREILWT